MRRGGGKGERKYHEEAEGARRIGDESSAASERVGGSEAGEAEHVRGRGRESADFGDRGAHGAAAVGYVKARALRLKLRRRHPTTAAGRPVFAGARRRLMRPAWVGCRSSRLEAATETLLPSSTVGRIQPFSFRCF